MALFLSFWPWPVSVAAQTREPKVPGIKLSASDAVSQVQSFAADPTLDAQLARQVLALFREKTCVKCHGSAVTRPKEFGYIDDLAKLRADLNLIVPGNPDDSELVFQVEEGLMPPESAEIPPLNPDEVQLVRNWIARGAPAAPAKSDPALSTNGGAVKPVEVQPEGAATIDSTLSATGRFLRFLGKFHPATVHFPIAFLVGALLAELWHVATGREGMKSALRFCLWLGALTAPPAALFGWLHAHHSGYADWTSFSNIPLAVHRWLGVATTCSAWVALIFAELRDRRENPGIRMWLHWSLLVAALLAALTGFFGGLVTYGLEHYSY